MAGIPDVPELAGLLDIFAANEYFVRQKSHAMYFIRRRSKAGVSEEESTMGQYADNSEIDAIRDLHQRGYTTDFMFHNGGLRDAASGKSFRPDELAIAEHHRFEGASNPDDESVVYAIESDNGVRGIVVDAFGLYADPALASLLQKIKLREKH